MIAGKDAPNIGEAKNSWLTGTAAWTFLNLSQYILGIRPDYDGLMIDPCIPEHIKGFKVSRTFRGIYYDIVITNPDSAQKGIVKLTVDGREINGNTIPYDSNMTGKTVKVIAVMG